MKGQKVVQDWQYGSLEAPSKVTFALTQQGETTTVELLHENIPEDEVETFSQGWKEHYFLPMQKMLG